MVLLILTIALAIAEPLALAEDHPRLESAVWRDVDGSPLPFQSDEEIEDFLKRARVVENKGTGFGTSGARRVLLEMDGIRARACFRTVSFERKKITLGNGKVEFDFRDEARFEKVAYELGRLLGIRSIPPVVEREVRGESGTLQIWLEDAMMESERQERALTPPSLQRWGLELQTVHLFDNLVFNDDRNSGNLLIDRDWRIWMIDHTRAFRKHKQLKDKAAITACERTVWERLRNWDEAAVRKIVEPYLRGWEINGLLKRQELLIKHIEGLIEERGEARVLFSLDPAGPGEGAETASLGH